MALERLEVVDSHTGGEPTRLLVAGGPELGSGPLSARRQRLAAEFDSLRKALLLEPRGNDVLVGALLLPPADPRNTAGVIFCNNVGYLGMCGHGTIGVVVSLGFLGRIAAGRHFLETPVGVVPVQYDGRHAVEFDNVPSYRAAKDVAVEVPGFGRVVGDVAWGGNWFYLVRDHGQRLDYNHAAQLTNLAERIRAALQSQGITGADGAPIDHIELFGPAHDPQNQSRNFVLCPGGAYDRSPCGTGTSAKLACLAADGHLMPGQLWRQESIVGSVFTGSYRWEGDRLVPTIRGEAYVTAQATLVIDADDPFAWGLAQ